MNINTTVQYDNDRIMEVKTVWDDAEANSLLSSGKWVILHGGLAHKDSMGYMAKTCYVMARVQGDIK